MLVRYRPALTGEPGGLPALCEVKYRGNLLQHGADAGRVEASLQQMEPGLGIERIDAVVRSGHRGPLAPGPAMSGAELAVLLIEKGGWAAVATLGFAVLFNVPKYALPYCALIGALGYALRTALMSGGGMGIVLATLCAALLVGVLATILAQRFGVSGTLFAVGPAKLLCSP